LTRRKTALKLGERIIRAERDTVEVLVARLAEAIRESTSKAVDLRELTAKNLGKVAQRHMRLLQTFHNAEKDWRNKVKERFYTVKGASKDFVLSEDTGGLESAGKGAAAAAAVARDDEPLGFGNEGDGGNAEDKAGLVPNDNPYDNPLLAELRKEHTSATDRIKELRALAKDLRPYVEEATKISELQQTSASKKKKPPERSFGNFLSSIFG